MFRYLRAKGLSGIFGGARLAHGALWVYEGEAMAEATAPSKHLSNRFKRWLLENRVEEVGARESKEGQDNTTGGKSCALPAWTISRPSAICPPSRLWRLERS